MRINYQKAIKESEEELERIEKGLRGKKTQVRVRMLIALKKGLIKSIGACADLLNYSWIQLTRWWKQYKEEGIEELLRERKTRNRKSRLTEEIKKDLEAWLETGNGKSIREVRRYLKEKWGIMYKSDSGVWRLFKKLKIKKKTGRPIHYKTDLEEQEAFKKNFLQN